MVSKVPRIKLNSGYEIPQLGFGTWLSKDGEVGDAIKNAIAIGYRHIDTAFGYGNQVEIGKALKGCISSNQVKREELFVTSKIWNTYHSFGEASRNLDMILSELQLDYLDLCLIHWPHGFKEGGEKMPKDADGKMLYSDADYLETWKALESGVEAGKVRSIGLSNFNSHQISRVLQNAKIKPSVLQVECHPYFPQTKLLEFCKQNGILFTAFSPLSSPGNIFRKEGDRLALSEAVVEGLANAHKKTAAQILLRWAIQRGTVVIPKSVNKDRIEQNFDLWNFELSQEDMRAIDGLDAGSDGRILKLERDQTCEHFPFKPDVEF